MERTDQAPDDPEAEREAILATLARVHPGKCGTHNGYLQISRARRELKAIGYSEPQLPMYDQKCKDAWAIYTQARRDRGGKLGLPKGPRPGAEVVLPLSVGAECGTELGVVRHRREGTPLCADCRPQALRLRVKQVAGLARKRRPKD